VLTGAGRDLLMLACADKLDNVRSIHEDLLARGEKLWTVFRRPREAQRWYYESLVDVLRPRMTEGSAAVLFREFEREVRAVFG